MIRVTLGLVAIVVSSAAAALTPQRSAPARDTLVNPTKGTATVSGVVLNDEEPSEPVRRTTVVLAGDGLRPSRGAITDDEGRFTFTDLPAGQFTITVSRASFITSMYGAKRPGRPGTPIAVAEGARIGSLTVKIWRGAVVAGTLRDDMGAPVAGIEVAAVPARAPGSLLTLTNNPTVTNELGAYRIFGLEPGTYLVAARPSAGGAAGYLSMSDAETDAAIEALRRRNVNQANTSPLVAPSAPQPTPQRPFDYAPVYFPGTPVMGQAAPVTLTAGQVRVGLDFSLQRVSTAIVTGVVTRPDGSPAAGASIQLTAVVPPGPFAGNAKLEINATTAPDGTFRIAQVSPGAYQLVARGPSDLKAPGIRPGYIEPPSTPQLFAVVDLNVAGADIPGVALSLAPGLPIAGRFVFDSKTRPPPANLAGLRVSLIPESLLPLASGRGYAADSLRVPAPAVGRPDGTFEFISVAPGRYQVWIGATGVDVSAWQLKSAMAQSVDVLDGLIEITPGSAPGLVVTYDDRPTRLSGKLETSGGAPAADLFVLAFSADRSTWGPYTRRVKAVRPGVDGVFSFQGLPEGDYLLAAITDADPEDWQTQAFLEQLVPVSVRIRLIAGQPVVQGLRIAR